MFVRRNRENRFTDAHLRRSSAWRHLAELAAEHRALANAAAELAAVQRLHAFMGVLWRNRSGKLPGSFDRRKHGISFRVPEPPSWRLVRHMFAGDTKLALLNLRLQTDADLRFAESGIAFFADRVAEDLVAALAAART